MPLKSGNFHEVLQVFESGNRESIDHTLTQFQEQLMSVDDSSSLINELVDFYILTGNISIRELLQLINRQKSKTLLSRIDGHMQNPTSRIKAIGLLGYIVRKEPNWIYEIIPSKTVFSTLLKCLQEDTDLPTVTSAVYVLVTIMPKVASQLSNYLQSLCKIFFRLVSWHTIKPEGANDVNLMHLHAAVYALLLSLYGMFPCHFVKGLKEVYKAHALSMEKPKGSRMLKDKLRLFENSIQPLLEQVRFNPNLITDSLESEVAAEKWRKLASHEIVATIQRMSLDITENTNRCDDHLGRENVVVISPKEMKRISSCENNTSPTKQPHTATESLKNLTWPGSEDGLSIDEQFIQMQLNNITPERNFVPNRPHQTVSNCSTPLFANVRFFSPNCSPSPGVNPENPMDQKVHLPINKDVCVALQMETTPSNNESRTENIEGCWFQEQTKINLPTVVCDHQAQENQRLSQDIFNELAHTVHMGGGRKDELQYIEQSPNEVRDLHIQLMKDAYFKNVPKYAAKDQDAEWRFGDGNCAAAQQQQQHGNKNSSSNTETSYLRSQVLQAHFAMLYERHKHEQHALRARKYIRKLYDTQKIVEELGSMDKQMRLLKVEIDGHISTKKMIEDKYNQLAVQFDEKSKEMEAKLQSAEDKLKKSGEENILLISENERLKKENEELQQSLGRSEHRNFEYEQQTRANRINRKDVATFEKKLKETRLRMMNVEMQNEEFLNEKKLCVSRAQAELDEAKNLIQGYLEEKNQLLDDNLKEETVNLQMTIESLQERLQLKEQVIKDQRTIITQSHDLAKVQINAVEDKFQTQRKVNQRLELQLIRIKHELNVLKELTKNQDIKIEFSTEGRCGGSTVTSNSPSPCLTPNKITSKQQESSPISKQ